MEFKTLVLLCVIAFIVLILIFFPEARTMLVGLIKKIFVKDLAQTPEGAEAIYQVRIDEAQDAYNQASDRFRKQTGKLKGEQERLVLLEKELKKVEQNAENLVKAGKMEEAQIQVEHRAELLNDIERSKQLINAYKKVCQEAEQVFKHNEQKLKDTKKEARDIVENMRVKQQLEEAYDDLDELKASSTTDKLIESIREKNKSLNESVEGARILHENKTSTKIARSNEAAKKIANDDYFESLKKKYNKK